MIEILEGLWRQADDSTPASDIWFLAEFGSLEELNAGNGRDQADDGEDQQILPDDTVRQCRTIEDPCQRLGDIEVWRETGNLDGHLAECGQPGAEYHHWEDEDHR